MQASCILIPWLLQSCFTGVEGTSKITLSKKEISAVSPSGEEIFVNELAPTVVKDWPMGKAFLIADEKLSLIVENNGNLELRTGDTIYYDGIKLRTGPDGSASGAISFLTKSNAISYPLEKTPDLINKSVTSAELPMVIDLETVEKFRNKLIGKKLWTRTTLWYDACLRHKRGRKFASVTVTDVEAGNAYFPLKVSFSDESGNSGVLLMNTGSSGNESRSFSRLFSLTDPRTNYPNVSESNWNAIQNEELREGMTKEECRLSRGNPSDIDRGHDYSNTMEIWYYPNGSYLKILNGILIEHK